jgi:hypothetical protein
MRRSRSEDGHDAVVAVSSGDDDEDDDFDEESSVDWDGGVHAEEDEDGEDYDLAEGLEAHPVLTRPAFLSHIFKFVVRKRNDFKLIYVHTAWEDTAVNYSPWMWQRLIRSHEQPPPLEGTPAIEEVSQHFFNHFVCRVWARTSNYPPSIFDRLVTPPVVDLSYVGVTDSALAYLGKHATITELHLSECRVTDAGLACISGLKHLRTLNLKRCDKITDAGLVHLTGLQQLQSLNIGGCDEITDHGLRHIAGQQQLQALAVWSCKQITDAGVKHIGSLQQLLALSLGYCDKITDAGVLHVAGLRQLQTLNLGATQITDSGLELISGLKQLQTLHLFSCKQITDHGLRHISGLQQLQTLHLEYSFEITDAALQHLASLPLKRFSARGCYKITARARAPFMQAHPNCEASF